MAIGVCDGTSLIQPNQGGGAERSTVSGRVENRFSLLPVSVDSLASSFAPRFRASASIDRTMDTQRASPAPPHRTVREVLPHTALLCSSSDGMRIVCMPPYCPA